MDGRRICRLVDPRYPVLDGTALDRADVTPETFVSELIPLHFTDVPSVHELEVTPPPS